MVQLSAGPAPETIPDMPISVTTPRGLQRLAAPLRALVQQVLQSESRRLGEVAIVLDDDELLRQINCDWRGIDRATDVISFAYDEREPDAATRAVRGDLLVSMDRVFEQAQRFRVTPGTELARLVVHGSLHLCGHDHMKAGERKLMRVREEAMVRRARPAARAIDAVLSPLLAAVRAAEPAGKALKKPVGGRASKLAAKTGVRQAGKKLPKKIANKPAQAAPKRSSRQRRASS